MDRADADKAEPRERSERLRVLIADDHPLFRDGLRMLLGTTEDLEVVGEADSGDAAVEQATASATPPDIIVMDVKMPGLSGIEATRRIASMTPQVHILIATMFDDDASVFAAMRAGARGYILKDAAHDDVLRAIRAVGRGDAIFSPSVATRILESFSAARHAIPRELFPMLTERERDILSAMARGYSNAEIARQFDLTPKTVRNYVSAVLSKLQVVDRAEAIIKARDAGLGR